MMKPLSQPASYPYTPMHKHYGFAVFGPQEILSYLETAQNLKNSEPNCIITWFITSESEIMLQNNPCLDQVVVMEGSAKFLETEIPRLQTERSWSGFFTPDFPKNNSGKRILLGQLGLNGDCLHATVVARQIKHDYPGCHLTWAISSLCRSIIEENPFVDEIWEFPAENWNQIFAAWYQFEQELQKRVKQGEFDELFFTQIYPGNTQNYDGTTKVSLLRGYPKPITVPLQNILRLRQTEVEKVRIFAEQHNLQNRRNIILFECASSSNQSFVTLDFALSFAQGLLSLVPDCSIILSSKSKVPVVDARIVDGSTLSLRENAELTKYCSLFIGCSSGVTQTALTDWAKPLPMIQLLLASTSVYASIAHDLEYWGLSSEQVLEMTDLPPERLIECVYLALTRGFAEARLKFHQKIQVDFNFYLTHVRSFIFPHYVKASRSLLNTVARYGWHQQLKTFIQTELMPTLGVQTPPLLSDEVCTKLLEDFIFSKEKPQTPQEAVKTNKQLARQMPLVSVCIPTYNGEQFLEAALASAIAQTYSHIEIIVSDDNSTDKTVEIAKIFQQKYPAKITILNHHQYGLVQNWNFCISQAKGKYIKFLFQDDLLEPDCIEKMVNLAEQDEQIGLVFSPRNILMSGGAEANSAYMPDYQNAKDTYKAWLNLKAIQSGQELLEKPQLLSDPINKIGEPTTILIKKNVFDRVGVFDADLCQLVDVEMWLRIMSQYKIGFVYETLSHFRIHPSQQTRKNSETRQTILSDWYKFYHKIHVDDRYPQNLREEAFNKYTALGKQHPGLTTQPLNELHKSRKQLAETWLSLPIEQLENAYASELGKTHQMLLNSAIKDDPFTDTEKTFIDRLASHLSQGVKNPKDINYLLAAALYRRADQLMLNYENAVIPNWFVNDYLKFMFAAPTLFQEIGEADNYCRYVQGWVSYLHSNIFKNPNSQVWQDIAWFFTQSANFIPLYFNSENLKDIYTKRADIIEYAMKNRGAAIDCIFPARPANRPKIRLGVLTKHFGAMTETFATLPAFEYLNREQFEIILYALNLDGNKLEQYCQSRADRLVKLSNDLPSQVQTIRADDLDILLIATNITAVTHPISLLALHRLARVQTTCFNSPITTGMRHIDYYIAGKLMEPALEGQEHYREQLATIDGPGCCFSYTLEPYTPNINFTRNSIGISEESVVFISSANLYKLVPELRETWAKIMAAVPNSVLFLMPFGPSWTNHYPGGAFVNNMKAVFAKYGIESNRLRVLKSFPNRADVKEVLKLGDVYLDSYPYAGTTSLVDPLEVGLPTVVRDGDTLRSRMGAAVVRSLSMPDLIANSEASYIQLAVTLGTNPELRQRYRQEIQQKMQANPACFDSVAYSGAIGKLFQELFGQWQSSHLEASRHLQDSIPKQPDFDEILSNTVNLYQRNSSNISAISELRQIRKQIADFWLNVPAENLEAAYKSASGKSYQILLKSGFQRQAMIESEQRFLQQLTQISKGLVHPKAVNALLAAMLYFPPGTMRIPDARNRLPHWLIGDYEQVFETEAAAKSESTSDLLAQYIQSPQFANQLLGCVNLYRIDPSDESVVLELRQIRKQMADFWLTVPSEKLESFYRGEVRKGYQAILSCGLQAESMTEAEQQFLQRLTEISKGLVQPQAINALLGAMLYFVPGKMLVPDARTRLPQWLLEDYEKVFESAFATTEPTVVKQDYMPQFLNQLTAAVNLYEIDPTAELVIADLRHIRKQIADLWLSVSGEQVEVLYRSDFGKGYKAMLGSGFIKEPLNESDREFFNSLVVELSKGFGTPNAVNNLLAAMLFCRPGLLRVQDANTCLPEWLLADYEQLVGGAVKVAVG
ncbi:MULTISPECIES: glycosyltransferase [unclassified Microcoleus]|uniref:glycosyltransferase n=1 Tax=unclassified Microcoleus TaxID=2642155 RepID=UPI002FD679F8